MNHPTIPIPAPYAPLLHYAATMRHTIDAISSNRPPTPRACMIAYYQDMLDIVNHGYLVAIDLTLDLAFVFPDDPNIANYLILDDDALRARIRDMIAMRSSKLN